MCIYLGDGPELEIIPSSLPIISKEPVVDSCGKKKVLSNMFAVNNWLDSQIGFSFGKNISLRPEVSIWSHAITLIQADLR